MSRKNPPLCDIFSRLCIGIKIDNSICANSIIEIFESYFFKYNKPEIIRTDNGPEFISKGSPWENEILRVS